MRPLFREGSATWARRPLWANSERFAKLKAVRVWATAVDLGIAIQRSVREKEAWIRFYSERRRMMGYHFDDLRRMQMPEADDVFIGFWANGASEKTVLHLMAAKVPCFIVHEYPGTSLPRPRTDVYTSFTKNTIAEFYLGDTNPYDRLAAAEPTRLHAIFDGSDGRGTGRLALATEEMRSSSVYLQHLREQVDSVPYFRPGTPPPPPAPVPRVSPPSASAPGRKLNSPSSLNTLSGLPKSAAALAETAWGVSGWNSTPADFAGSRKWGESTVGASSAGGSVASTAAPSASVSTVGAMSASGSKPRADTDSKRIPPTDRYAAPPIERRRVDSERYPWVVPPPVAVPPPKGKWQKWELSTFRDGKAWLGRGARARPSGVCFFDRLQMRELYMRESPVPPGVLNDEVFGRPVPRYPFFYESGENASYKAAPHRSSHWMYRSRAPGRGDIGRTALEPSARELPRLPEHPARDSAGQILQDRPPSPTDGNESESDEGGDESDSGDERPDDDPPSAILCVSGVSMGLSAVNFAAIARDAFFHAEARPQTIVGSGQQMWLSFETISEARRARGTLIGLSEDITLSYGLVDRFMRAWNSSTDRWWQETMMDVEDSHDEPAPVITAPITDSSEASFGPAPPTQVDTTLFGQPVATPIAAALPPVTVPRTPSPIINAQPEAAQQTDPTGMRTAEEEYPDLFPVEVTPMAPSATTTATVESDVVMGDATGTVAERLYLPRPFQPSSQAQCLAALPPRPLVPLPAMPVPALPSMPSLADRLTDPSTPAAPALADRISGRALLHRLTDPRPPLADRLTDPLGSRTRQRGDALGDRLGEIVASPAKKRPRKLRKPAAPAPVAPPGEPLGDGEEEIRKRGRRGGKRKQRNHAEAEARRERRRLREEEAQQMHLDGIAVQQAGGGDELLEMAEAFHVANAEEALENAINESLGNDVDVVMEDATAVWTLHDDDDPPIGGARF
ncbi:hypothetical protein C8R43DRAFT_1122732 [Mycena crocata]|nr:hypothetical protein C8R43DRAFT_1122732 [Mycena crocata]